MARPHAASNSAVSNPTNHATADSSHSNPVGDTLKFGGTDFSRSAGLRAIERLRKQLDTIDEHSRELRNARHILLKREQSLVQEREELVESLNTVEVALMERLPSYPSGTPQRSTAHNTSGELIEDNEEFELPSKRQAISVIKQGTSKPAPLTALATEPTLIAECPPQLLHLLQPSKSLPRPPSSSPPPSFTNTPVSPQRSGSITRNGIRFPPGSVPRLSRGRSSSPLTQMLPPPVPSSPATPTATKGYNPIIRDLSPPEFESPITRVGSVATHDNAVSPPQPKLGLESDRAYAEPPRLSRPQNGTIPIYLMLNNSSSGWSLTHMDPERTPSPPIGAPRSSWTMRPDVHAKHEEFGESMESEKHDVKTAPHKVVCEQHGPASRTRARLNGGGTASKGKGRV